MKNVLLAYLKSKGYSPTAINYYDFDVWTTRSYGCETCGPEFETEQSIYISYQEAGSNASLSYREQTTFMAFIEGLTGLDV